MLIGHLMKLNCLRNHSQPPLNKGELKAVILNGTKCSEESRLPVNTGFPAKAGFRKLNFASLRMTFPRISYL